MAPPKVTQWVNENFLKPRVDPEWLDGCCEWLIGDQNIDPLTSFPEFIKQVEKQLLGSDLHDSMLHGTGLDVHIKKFTGNLKGPPVLVQITAISDIGISAFQLDQVRMARKGRLISGVGNEEGEEEGDIDVEGEGPMPKYPRATLRFKLSDGVTTLEAMEYRPLPQISLGPTPLGYKLKLKGTRIQNGMAFLEPATVVLLGGSQEQLEARQLLEFENGLRERLGLPHQAEPEAPVPVPAPPAPAPVPVVRSPLRDISPPPSPPLFPQHDDDMDMGTRRRRVPKPSSTSTTLNASSSKIINENIQGRPIIGLPRDRKSNTSATISNENKHISESDLDLEVNRDRRPKVAERNTLTYPASQKNTTSSHYFNKNNSKRYPDDVNMDVENLDLNLSPTMRQLTHPYRPSPSTSADIPLRVQLQQRQDKSFDFDLLDEIDQDENQPPLPGQQQPSSSVLHPPQNLKGKGRAEPSSPFVVVDQRQNSLSKFNDASSDDYGMGDDHDFADVEFLESVSRVEKEAWMAGGNANGPHVPNVEGSGSYVLVDGGKKTSLSTPASALITSSKKPIEHLDIIEIDSDEDDGMLGTDDKENEPVATRHVKRRTEDLDEGVKERGRGLFANQGWNPPLNGGGSGRRNGGLGIQVQNSSQGLKPRVLATRPDDVIDISDSDDD